ncbi:uncharacterized protein LOC110159790 [Boleophthalmus pectinirostris]|uniref:uncharacterized protein LOC110159790 n=1 Tax=Boleophthalmus pectinirostris TaxID=150288 RepID=UPI00242BE99F|nr:uncharacterized protein LOC110159790 [Boleophthalmus pectinirostris]
MLESFSCQSCMAPLQPDDGHDLCPACLGEEHLQEALTEDACSKCSILPRSVRLARLAAFREPSSWMSAGPSDLLPAGQPVNNKRHSTGEECVPRKKPKKGVPGTLSAKVDTLTSELAQMRALIQNLQADANRVVPPHQQQDVASVCDDAMSVAASDTHFQMGCDDLSSKVSDSGSLRSTCSQAESDESVTVAIRTALGRLKLDVPLTETAPSSAFFRRQATASHFAVPPSTEYVKELHACWTDTKAFSRPTSDGRALAAMRDPHVFGLGHMPAVEPAVASLIVPPEETLRTNARCPRPQCRVTDDLLCKAYDMGARMGRIGNSLSHLLLGLSVSLEALPVDQPTQGLLDASLQAFALMSRELGRLLSTLVQARRQVWLAQSPLSEASRRTLRSVPVVPGELFGSAALEALERTAQATRTRQQLAGLHRRAPHRTTPAAPPPSSRSPGAAPPSPPRARGQPGEAVVPAVGHFTREQLEYWATHSPDTWVVATLSRGYQLQFRRRPPVPGQVKMTIIGDTVKAHTLAQEIRTLLDKGAIVPVDPLLDPGGVYSRYFLVPKKTGDLRPVLDLRGLNMFLKVLPFKMLGVKQVLQAILPGDWFTSIDLKDAYFHVPIAPHHWRFLRFAFRGEHFQFKVLPFGLSLSPRVFTRCVSAALSPLQVQGLRILPYLDDWLICAPTRNQVLRDTQTVLRHVSRLGLRVNVAKSCLVPSQVTTFLGMVLDSRAMTARPSPKRIRDILDMLPEFQCGMSLPYIKFLSLLGKLTAASAVVPLGLLSLRPLQMWLNGLHLDPACHAHRRRRLLVTSQCMASLSQWSEAFMLRGVPLGPLPSRREVVNTDASLVGWGATWQGRTAQGLWSVRLSRLHINSLEFMAVWFALHHFLPYLRGRHVVVRCDNTSVVFHLNHEGGTRSESLLRMAQLLLTWAAPRFASLRAVHIPGVRNTAADFLSRQGPLPGEWRLHPEVVEHIWEMFGRANVDLFASQETTHCPLWFSWTECASPLGQDALAHDWPRTLLYAFPPFPLIFQTLLRVLQEGHSLLLVAPFWPARPWFPLLLRLCSGPAQRLPSRRDLLSQLGGQILHPDPGRLKLWVWPLQGPA